MLAGYGDAAGPNSDDGGLRLAGSGTLFPYYNTTAVVRPDNDTTTGQPGYAQAHAHRCIRLLVRKQTD